MAVELAEVEELVENDLGLDFFCLYFLGLRVDFPFEALEWTDQDLGSDRDELPQRFVAFVATCRVLTPRLALAVEVTLDDVDQFLPFSDTHKIGEQIELGIRRYVLWSQEAAGLAARTCNFFVRDETKYGIEDLGLTDTAGK